MASPVSASAFKFNPTSAKADRDRAIASGKRHALAEVSYQGGFSVCSCGHREEADESIGYVAARHEDLAGRMNQHLADANGRKAWLAPA